MPVEVFDGGIVAYSEDGVTAFRLLFLKGRLKLEAKGYKFRRSVYAQIKREFGFRGNKAKVLEQYEAMLRKKGVLR